MYQTETRRVIRAPRGERHDEGTLHRIGRVTSLLWAHLGRTRTLGLAAEMSFWLFSSLLPLAAVAAYVAARLALHDWSLVAPILASMPSDAQSVLTGELARVSAWNGGAVTPLAGVLFVWFASTGVHSIFDAFEAQTGASRSWVVKRLIAIGCCAALSCACAAIALLGSAIAWGVHVIAGDHGALASRLLQGLFGVVLLYALIAGLYRVGLPYAVRREIPLVPGTILVVVLELALGLGYRFYISTLGNGGAYLAGLAVIAVTMTTIYLFSVSILVGLGLSQILGTLRERHEWARKNDTRGDFARPTQA
jgi:membrane protein